MSRRSARPAAHRPPPRCRLGAAALALALVPAAAAGCGGDGGPARNGPDLHRLFRVDGLERPESVAWDSARSRWLVTNAAGEAGAGGGFVTAVSRDGGTVVRRAYDSDTPGLRLDAPKGIAVSGDRAYVADIHRVVAIDLADDSAAFEVRIPESRFLNDVALDGRGVIYVSDTRGDAVYRVAPDGSGWTLVPAAGSLRGPNGLVVEPLEKGRRGRILVAGWDGAVSALNPDSSVTLLAEAPSFQNLDGLQRSPSGDLLVTDFSAGRLQLLQRGPRQVWRAGVPWLDGLDRPADFLIRGDVLALPELGANRVTFYRIRG